MADSAWPEQVEDVSGADRARADAEWGGTPAALDTSGATWHDLARDQQTRRGAAPARSDPPTSPARPIVLYPPFAAPGVTDAERRTIVEMMAKGTYAFIIPATKDLDGTSERLLDDIGAAGQQSYGVRDCAFRDPAGTLIRIQELR